MKHIYTIVTLFLLMFVGTSCEDDYRDMVLFEGVEPIYQIGTCDNLISSVTLYLTDGDGIVLGVDGGDGDYSLEIGDVTVATAEFVESNNGYRRIRVVPKGESSTAITVRDSSGKRTVLHVQVYEYYKIVWNVRQRGFGLINGNVADDSWRTIQMDIEKQLTMKMNGRYEMIPADKEDHFRGGGALHVYPDADSETPLIGTYEAVEGDNSSMNFRFLYNGEVHVFTTKNPLTSVTRTDPIQPLLMWEEVTSLSPVALPEGCKVYQAEQWMYTR